MPATTTALFDNSDPPEVIGWQITQPDATTLYSDITGNPGTNPWLRNFEKHMQGQVDVRIPLDDDMFKEDGVIVDPDALVDPEREDFFHDTSGPPPGFLVARSEIAEAEWDNGKVKISMHTANPF